jgi:DNA-binding MarR family transcriptional regulator
VAAKLLIVLAPAARVLAQRAFFLTRLPHHVQILNTSGFMKSHSQRDLEILTAIDEGTPLTQRDLAKRLGVALGLTNLYIKRLAKKGFIKITEFPHKPAARKRLRYLLTPRGIGEKTRLTYEHMAYSLHLYRRARATLRESLGQLSEMGMKRVALYGTGEAAELSYLALKESGLELVGVFAREPGGVFLGMPVRSAGELAEEEFDGLVLATFEPPEPQLAELTALAVPREKCLTLRRAEQGGVLA